jgi:hypothetical protein
MVNYISDDQYNLPIADRQEHLLSGRCVPILRELLMFKNSGGCYVCKFETHSDSI